MSVLPKDAGSLKALGTQKWSVYRVAMVVLHRRSVPLSTIVTIAVSCSVPGAACHIVHQHLGVNMLNIDPTLHPIVDLLFKLVMPIASILVLRMQKN